MAGDVLVDSFSVAFNFLFVERALSNGSKKRKGVVWINCHYCCRFLIAYIIATVATATAIIVARVLAMKYISFDGIVAVGYGEGVTALSATLMYVCEDDGPYALLPGNVAIIWYVPGTCGVQSQPNTPELSLVTFPIVM